MMKKKITVFLCIILSAFLIYRSLKAFEDGIVGLTRKDGNNEGCSCHSLSPFQNVSVIISGPSSVIAGDTAEYKLKISGGPLVRAGCDIAAGTGLVILSPLDTSLQRLQATLTSFELTHTWPKLPVNDTVTFIFKYIAPNTSNVADTIFANGNSVNYDHTNNGDRWNFADSKPILIISPIGIRNFSSTISDLRLEQNYPNPFNPATKIKFNIPSNEFPLNKSGLKGAVSLKIFDVTGKEITTLLDEQLSQGTYEINFNADKYNLSSGIYYYKLIVGDFSKTKAMILIK